MSNLMDEGLGSFVFSDDAAGTRRSIRVFFFRPRSCVRDTRIVIAMHGFDRAASDFRDVLVDQAERRGARPGPAAVSATTQQNECP
jgi:hypothetical protein